MALTSTRGARRLRYGAKVVGSLIAGEQDRARSPWGDRRVTRGQSDREMRERPPKPVQASRRSPA